MHSTKTETSGPSLASAALMRSTLPEPITVSVKEACRLGSFGATTCYELLKQGKLKSVTLGRRRLIDYASLRAMLAPRAA